MSDLAGYAISGSGALNIIYSVSDHGSCSQTYMETKWTTYPPLYKPANYYGIGS